MAAPATPLEALQTAFGRHETFVRERLRGLGVPADQLDDASQDVFETLVRRMDAYDPERPLQPWLAGIARKVAKRHRERAGRRPLELVAEPRGAERDDPERAAMTEETRRRFDRFVNRLSPEQWEVFVLAELEGLRGTEVAAELGVNLSTVYARQRAAKKQLDRAMGPQGRWLPAWVPFVGLDRGGKRGVWATVGLVGVLGIAVGSYTCAGEEAGVATPSEVVEREAARTDEGKQAGAAGVAERRVDPAGLAGANAGASPDGAGAKGGSTEAREGEWISQGTRTSHRDDAMIEVERHYRIVGDTLELRLTYIGDEEEAMLDSLEQFDVDGMEIVQPLPEHVEIPAGKTVVTTAKVRAIREGQVSLSYTHGEGNGSAGSRMQLLFEHGKLHTCGPDECRDVAKPLEPSDETKTVQVRNHCDASMRFAIAASLGDPAPDTPLYDIDPGEERTMTVPAAAKFLMLDDDGKAGVAASTDGDGTITFAKLMSVACGIQASDNP